MKFFKNFYSTIILYITLLFCILVPASHATTISAASASYSDVNAAIDQASSGDIIFVPAGEANWENQLNITKNIQIIGAGVGNTIITATYEAPTSNTFDSRTSLIYFHPSSPTSSQLFRLSGFTFDLDLKCGALFTYNTSTTFQVIRVDNNAFKNTSSQRTITNYGQMRGVIDNNTFDNIGSAISTYGSNATCWSNLTYSYGTADTLYYEDNTFTNLKDTPHSGGAGGRYVARYNTYTTNLSGGLYPWYDAHGNQGAGMNHSAMATEIYGNTMNHSYPSAGVRITDIRGGKAIAFDNNVVATAGVDSAIREEYADSLNPPATGPEGQPQHPSDAYFWNNTKNTSTLVTITITQDTSDGSTANSPAVMVENTTHFQERSGTFDGSGDSDKGGGVGIGKIAYRPNTCTPGVAYWATDAGGNWNLTNETENDGCLYKYSDNTWALYYIPYKYPHPLRGPTPPKIKEVKGSI